MAQRFPWVGPWLLACVLPLACGGPESEPPEGRSDQPIINGTTDPSTTHNAIVYLKFTLSDTMCTGTLITPKAVITAAHCTSGEDKSHTYAGVGPTNTSLVWYPASRIWTNPGYDSTTIVGDIALIELTTAPPGVTPIPFLPAAKAVSPADVGAPMVLVGYGLTDAASPNSYGTRMKTTNTLDWLCTEANPAGCDLDGMYTQTPKKTFCFDKRPLGSGGVCNGDSGGPALLNRDGLDHVAGLTSFGDVTCQYFGCHTKVDEYESSILAFAGAPNGAACADGLNCQTGFCKDSVCCDTACAGPCRVCNQTGSVGTCLSLPDGLSCSDNNVCNGVEVCHAGVCAGTPLACADTDPCTLDLCDAITGCYHVVAPDGSSCSDDNACNGQESCVGGACRPGTTLVCTDENPCTEDRCDAAVGCLHPPVPNGTDCSDQDP